MKHSLLLIPLLAILTMVGCGGGKETVHLTIEQIEVLNQIIFYRHNVSNVKVERTKPGVMFDDHCVAYYSGHVDLGVDFTNVKNEVRGDTVILRTKIGILNTDNKFVDSHKYVDGNNFSDQEMKEIDAEGNQKILSEAEKDNCYLKAEEYYKIATTSKLKEFGFNVVIFESEK